MDIKTYLTDLISSAAGGDATVLQKISLEHPANPEFGDYSTNIALILANGANPRQFATELVEKIQTDLTAKNDTVIADVTVAGPGFINFMLSEHFLLEEMKHLITDSEQVVSKVNQGKRIVIEFTDPNPFKQFHIGHLYSNTVGESICRLLEATGAQVRRVNYFGDVGMHVAKSVWGMREKLLYEYENSVKDGLENLAEKPLTDRVLFLGQAYAKGSMASAESEQAKAQIALLNKLLYVIAQELMIENRGWQPIADYKKHLQPEEMNVFDHDEITLLYRTGKAWSLAYFQSIYDRVGMAFDEFYPESEVAEQGMKYVFDGLKRGVFAESKGAIVYEGEKHGLHTRVFINSSGLPTYEAKELGLAPTKYQDDPYDQSIIVTANEIDEYFKVLIAAIKELEPELGNKTKHIGHGMVRLPEGKMSSRTGQVITGEWLLDEAKDQISEVLSTSKTGFSSEDAADVAEYVGQAAIKYAFLKSNIGKDISFSFEESLSFQGNSGPYLQYTYVRCQSVLQKAMEAGFEAVNSAITNHIDTVLDNKEGLDTDLQKEEKDILRSIYQYSETVVLAAQEHAPHYVATYLFDLAQKFNLFYAKHQIVGSADEKTKKMRLALVIAVGQIIKDGLGLLNIKTVEKM
jgi:arginyl-tRNA synthetase